jgi:hypothetical protein
MAQSASLLSVYVKASGSCPSHNIISFNEPYDGKKGIIY